MVNTKMMSDIVNAISFFKHLDVLNTIFNAVLLALC